MHQGAKFHPNRTILGGVMMLDGTPEILRQMSFLPQPFQLTPGKDTPALVV